MAVLAPSGYRNGLAEGLSGPGRKLAADLTRVFQCFTFIDGGGGCAISRRGRNQEGGL
jgi:hypothetical protein